MVFPGKRELSCCLAIAAFSAPGELGIAQRYFGARQSLQAGMVALQGSETGSLRQLDFEGARWRMEVFLARPPRGVPGGADKAIPTKPDLMVDYSVEEVARGPLLRVVVRLTSPAWRQSGVFWEQELFEVAAGESARSRVRPCGADSCGPWRDWDPGRVVATAGRSELPAGIQAPLFLPIGHFAPQWRSEDFFGRETGLVWQQGRPWPSRLWNAQGEARLASDGGQS